MNRKTSRKQTLWVLIATVLLITLCAGGLWVYIKSADAETDVQETSLAELPKEDEITITWEKYDNFFPWEETTNNTYWREGYGLMRDEKARLESSRAEYLCGKRPQNAAPTLPTETGFAIIPLDPASFGGVTEYYFLPDSRLTDEQLLQMIAYGEGKGVPFTADIMTAGNCMRGYTSEISRMFSAGELERRRNLLQRYYQGGLKGNDKTALDLSQPISGVAYIPMNPDLSAGVDTFVLFPLRELTDDELVSDIVRRNDEAGFTYLYPTKATGLNPTADSEEIRSLLADLMKMPESAAMVRTTYKRKDDTGEIRVDVEFESALINGKKMYYSAKRDAQSGRIIMLEQRTVDMTISAVPDTTQMPKVKEDIHDPRWIDVVREAAAQITNQRIVEIEARHYIALGNEQLPGALFKVILDDGDTYMIVLRLSDGQVMSVHYGPDGQDARVWYMDNQW